MIHTSPDEIRQRFSRRMSEMYRQEVPQYGALLHVVADINEKALCDTGVLAEVVRSGGLERLGEERHGAIRLGTASELSTMRRLFEVMGMTAVGYYDLSVANVPIHATASRPVNEQSLARNPFRVFTSLLRPELLQDPQVRDKVQGILSVREIFSPRVLELTAKAEESGGLTMAEADEFVSEALETFRWHGEATVSRSVYEALSASHRLVADIACFKGPHINHLTPRTLDIDKAHVEVPRRGIQAKDIIEGPPPRRVPILLRQTSFKALEERVAFSDRAQASSTGHHTARFGEIEQRGMALTRNGRSLYDTLLSRAQEQGRVGGRQGHAAKLREAFLEFPDDLDQIRKAGLGFFRYSLTEKGLATGRAGVSGASIDTLIADGLLRADPIIYEDFLPVSAAGIFQSNLGGTEQKLYTANDAKTSFEQSLGTPVLDVSLYKQAQAQSLRDAGCAIDC